MDKVTHTLKLLAIYLLALAMVALSSCGYVKNCRNAKGCPNNACFGSKRSGLIGY